MEIKLEHDSNYTAISFGIGLGKTSLYVGRPSFGIAITLLFWTWHCYISKA